MGELSELIAEGMERDEVVAEVAQLEQRVEEYQRDDEVWNKHSLVEIVDERNALRKRVEELESAMRGWLPRLKVIVDYAPKPLDDRSYAIFGEMEALAQTEE